MLVPSLYQRKGKREYQYGALAHCPIGSHFSSRDEMTAAMVHGPTTAGIHGNSSWGAYSVVLSGGYEDDKDEGIEFTYTGEGGRKGGTQVEDQKWSNKSNLSLKRSGEGRRRAVRVFRGHVPGSPYGPESGYDGLYQVIRTWTEVGKSGFRICRARFRRIPGQAPPPWLKSVVEEPLSGNEDSGTEYSSDNADTTAPGSGSEQEQEQEQNEENIIPPPSPVVESPMPPMPPMPMRDRTCTLPEKRDANDLARGKSKLKDLPRISRK
uniref:YDG domain-containing protein n=1 Tax=Moniliophthora roreri TaxID=221103 RepID=A0A0W0G9B4_MONRR